MFKSSESDQMKHRAKNAIRELTKYFGLKVKFVSYLSPDIHGRLFPRERRILINANKPRDEHLFTIFHEIGHFLIHFKNPRRKYHPRVFDLHCKFDFWTTLASKMRRYYRYIFNKESGKEWEADLWAMCGFVYFAKKLGCRGQLRTFLARHPEKKQMYWWVCLVMPYTNAKLWVKRFYHAFVTAYRQAQAHKPQSMLPFGC